jgi:hypothetical protein
VHQPNQVAALRATDGQKLCGFDASDERACIKPDKDNGVPKLTYNIEESMGQSLKSKLREPAKVGRKGIFGTCSERFHGSALSAPPTENEPGPGEHQNLEKRDGFYSLRGEQSVRGFRSALARFPRDLTKDNSERPCPGTYEIFDKVSYRNKFRQAKQDHLSFGSSASRWNPKEVFAGQKHIRIPGPGEYSPHSSKEVPVGGSIGSTNRDLQALTIDGSPGPGQYNTHGTTMHRMTYNVSAPEAALRAQGALRNVLEPPNIGGGAGGGISGTRARLGECHGGSGANTLAADAALEGRSNRAVKLASPSSTGRVSRRAITLSPTSQDGSMTFVTEPVGIATGWTIGKASSPSKDTTQLPKEGSGQPATNSMPVNDSSDKAVVALAGDDAGGEAAVAAESQPNASMVEAGTAAPSAAEADIGTAIKAEATLAPEAGVGADASGTEEA